MRRSNHTGWFLLLLLLPAAPGCGPPKQTRLMRASPDVKMSAAELRIRVRGLAPRFAGIIEEAADDIRHSTDDEAIRREAIRWKMQAIPTANQALFQPDPLVALIDVWAFTIQQVRYLDSGAGRSRFGDLQPIALDAARTLEQEAEDLARTVSTSGDLSGVERRLLEWERENPIEGPSFSRDSIASDVADLSAAKHVGSFAAIGGLSTDIADLAFRIDLLSDQLPKLFRWQTEYMLSDYLPRNELAGAIDDIGTVADALEAPSAVVADLPAMLDETKAELEVLVARERAAVLAEVDRQLRETFRYLTEERRAVIGELKGEREVILDAVRGERELIMAAVADERAVVMRDVESLGTDLLDQTGLRLEKAIDHFFVRLAQTLGVTLVVLAIGTLVLVRMVRRPVATG